MAGNDSLNTQINALFNRLKERFTPNNNLMDAIARHLYQSVMENFANQSLTSSPFLKRKSLTPDPFPKGRGDYIVSGGWKALKASTLREKRRKGLSERILEATGNLKRSIKTGSTESNTWVSTDAVYGAIHNFGGTINLAGRSMLFKHKGSKGSGFKEKIIKIPARPFLVLTEGFKERIVEEIKKQVGR